MRTWNPWLHNLVCRRMPDITFIIHPNHDFAFAPSFASFDPIEESTQPIVAILGPRFVGMIMTFGTADTSTEKQLSGRFHDIRSIRTDRQKLLVALVTPVASNISLANSSRADCWLPNRESSDETSPPRHAPSVWPTALAHHPISESKKSKFLCLQQLINQFTSFIRNAGPEIQTLLLGLVTNLLDPDELQTNSESLDNPEEDI